MLLPEILCAETNNYDLVTNGGTQSFNIFNYPFCRVIKVDNYPVSMVTITP
jgi:hypothetical protein